MQIGITAYNRAEKTISVIEALHRERAKDVILFLDFPDSMAVAAEQKRIRDHVACRADMIRQIVVRPHRLGLKASILNAMKVLFENGEEVLLLEDDIVLRPQGLDFFRQGLRQLRTFTAVKSICGYAPPSQSVPTKASGEIAVCLAQRFSPWGWATWRDRWNYDTDVHRLIARARDEAVFDRLPSDIRRLCALAEAKGALKTWSLNWILSHYIENRYCAYPDVAVLDNIGNDGSGENCIRSDVFDHEDLGSAIQVPRTWRPHWCGRTDARIRTFWERHALSTYTRDVGSSPVPQGACL